MTLYNLALNLSTISDPAHPTYDTEAICKLFDVPSLPDLRSLFQNLDNQLAPERWIVRAALSEHNSDNNRRWQANGAIHSVIAACKRLHLAEEARQPGWTRTPTERTDQPFSIIVRTPRIHTGPITCHNGLRELYQRLDKPPFPNPLEHASTSHGEFHIHQVYGNPRTENPSDCSPRPEHYGFNGSRTHGRANPLLLPSSSDFDSLHSDKPLTATVTTGIWMQREVPCHDPVQTLYRVAAEPINWDNWHAIHGMPLQRYVESIFSIETPEHLPPHHFRHRTRLTAILYPADSLQPTLKHFFITRQHARLAYEQARLQWPRIHGKPPSVSQTSLCYPNCTPVHPDELDPPLNPPPLSPLRAEIDFPNKSWILPSLSPNPLCQIANTYRDNNDPETAILLIRQAVQSSPYDLSALEDLAWAHRYVGNHDEYRGLIRELIARAEAMLPDTFSWNRNTLDYARISNRPFLHARRLFLATPNDNMGARYEILRLTLQQRNWKAAANILRKIPKADSSPETAYARAFLALHAADSPTPHSIQQAVNDYPLIASRILHGNRPSTLETSDNDGYGFASFEEAERFWIRNAHLWTCPDGERLIPILHQARENSPRKHQTRGTLSPFHDSTKISENLSLYQRSFSLAGDKRISSSHQNDFWDLAYHLESGGPPAIISTRRNRLVVTWHKLRITFTEPWHALVAQATDPPSQPGTTMHFDTLVNPAKHHHDSETTTK